MTFLHVRTYWTAVYLTPALASLAPLSGLAPRVVLQLVDDGPEVPGVGGGHQVSLRTGVVAAQGDVLQEGGLATLGPALSSLTSLLPGAPGTVRVLQADTLTTAAGLLTAVEADHLHLATGAHHHMARTFLSAHHSH